MHHKILDMEYDNSSMEQSTAIALNIDIQHVINNLQSDNLIF